MYLDAALFEILLPLYGLGLLRLERLEGGADFHFTLIAFDFLLVDLLLMLLDLAIMLLDLAKTVLDRANKMFAFRHYDCRSLAHAPCALQRDAAATNARVTRSRSKSFKSLDSRSGAKNATSSARSLMLPKAAMSSSAVMTPPSRRARRGAAQPILPVPTPTSRQSAGRPSE